MSDFVPENPDSRLVNVPVVQGLEPSPFSKFHRFTFQSSESEGELRNAIQNNEFELLYQPIIELATEEVVGAEVLLRWQHPVQGLLCPVDFMAALERSGLILDLDQWVLQTACQQLNDWRQMGVVNDDFFISVNFSAIQFAQPDFIPQLQAVLADKQLPLRCLKLEITETSMMQHAGVLLENLVALRNLQVQISVDDFGTGYSSLAGLHRLPIDYLKLDRAFIDSIHDLPATLGLVCAIVHLAKSLELPMIAEGIETSAQLAQLKLFGCELGQGFWFCEPLASTSMAEYLTAPS